MTSRSEGALVSFRLPADLRDGEGSRYLWPAHYDLRRIPIVDPTPVFPLWVIWRTDNRQPDLTELLAFLEADFAGRQGSDNWRPSWARHGH
jgi:hypothetical protein